MSATRMAPARLRWVIAVAGRAGLAERRAALLALLPPGVRGALEVDARRSDQLRIDLGRLNEWPETNGRHPLDLWIEAAVDLLSAEGRPEAEILRRLAAGGALPAGDPSTGEAGGRLPPGRRRWMAAALVVAAGGLAAWFWPTLPPGWVAVPEGAAAPGPGDLMRWTDEGWRWVAGPCVPAEAVRSVDDGARRVVDAADLARVVWAPGCDDALAEAAADGEGLTVVLEVQGPAHAPQRAEAWFGKPARATWVLKEGP